MTFIKNKRLLNYSERLRRLQISAVLLLLLLLIPLSLLFCISYQQAEKNRLSEYQQEASNLVRVINRKLFRMTSASNQIPVDAFNYYRYVHNPVTKQTQKVVSPLAQLDGSQNITGLVGYFQIDHKGNFNSPIWPNAITVDELSDTSNEIQTLEAITRREMAVSVYRTVFQSKSIKAMLNTRLDLKKNQFDVNFDLSEYIIFYRIVPVLEQPVLQGYVVKRGPYLHPQVMDILENRRFDIPIMVTLKIVDETLPHAHFLYLPSESTPTVSQPKTVESSYIQQPIYETRLDWPYKNYTLSVTSKPMPLAESTIFSLIFNGILLIAIVSACYGFYRFSVKQLALSEEKVNFISSVSHELKTPLTSIKMYSEMLKSGMVASPEHQGEYFDFICDESDRLARLIDNILQLSAFERQQQNVAPEYVPLTVLQNIIHSKISSLTDKHGFKQVHCMELAEPESVLAYIEPDAFTQVVINITDNAIKFFESAKINDNDRKKIDFTFCRHPTNQNMVQLEIRDYGNGISKEQEDKIFELFYRGSSELTRNTKGTGIGLALVRELVLSQQGEVQVQRRHPGLALLVSFKLKLRDE
ncbi:HAMP domain-containing histidine kinase [Pseudoalteromonas luteoviolacea]|uniref:sensor histidine kinase n=1 Tax=Pseudoalteromonas luteoviolacea TaxID=43657 RepID=UPI001B3A6D24|nr:HAMP domain-containing sensor histidine kinase [Pseudoalteromonas luteoviolacea]MBQ4879106.1 HAMP domain-containing histidine kinase [Pseudoalteromonas luteoviolacea]MBQ4908139.1 HAMP domain-containing histidine kinase [Pseudoalteromonas luteoviolacea]